MSRPKSARAVTTTTVESQDDFNLGKIDPVNSFDSKTWLYLTRAGLIGQLTQSFINLLPGNSMGNIYQLFQSRFDVDRPFTYDAREKLTASYGDLEAASAQYANLFLSLGLIPGDRVAVQIEKSTENLFLYFGCLRAGLVFLPLNTAYQKDEIAYFLNDAAPKVCIVDPEKLPTYQALTEAVVFTLDHQGAGTVADNRVALSKKHDIVDNAPEDTAVIVYTSGTTGAPKGAMITHGNLIDNGLVLQAEWDFQASDKMLHSLPIFHVHGLFLGIHLPVLSGCPIILLEKFDATLVLKLLPSATVFMGVPTYYTRLLEANIEQAHCQSIRLFTSGSAPLLTQTFNLFSERTQHTIVERYGMTETGMNTSNPLHGPAKAGTVGPSLPGTECKIINDDGNPVEINETGQLLVRGKNVFKGYWRKPEKTQEDFTDTGFFKTGDLASMDADGYVTIVGRSKDLIITGGLNVYPKEIELKIDNLPGVIESAVIGTPDKDFGETVTAIIIREASASLSEQEVINQLKGAIANFKVPKTVHFLDQLPRNTMGKVQKNVLRETFMDQST